MALLQAAPVCTFRRFARGFAGGFGAVFDFENAGRLELVEVFHDEVGDLEFEAGAFEFEAFHVHAPHSDGVPSCFSRSFVRSFDCERHCDNRSSG